MAGNFKSSQWGAGDLRHLVTVQRATETTDGAGGQIVVWSDFASVWCGMRAKSGHEKYEDAARGRICATETWEFVTWFRDDLRVTDRLFYRGKLYNIRDMGNENENGKWLVMLAEQGVEQ